jgi:hypothetical protein
MWLNNNNIIIIVDDCHFWLLHKIGKKKSLFLLSPLQKEKDHPSSFTMVLKLWQTNPPKLFVGRFQFHHLLGLLYALHVCSHLWEGR